MANPGQGRGEELTFEQRQAGWKARENTAAAEERAELARFKVREMDVRLAEIEMRQAEMPMVVQRDLFGSAPAAQAVALRRSELEVQQIEVDLRRRQFDANMALAEVLADSPYVPESIPKDQRLGFALGVIERAPMLGVNYWALAQNSYTVHGKLGLEVDFLQAIVEGKAEDLFWEVEIAPDTQNVEGFALPRWVEVRAQRDKKSGRWPVRVARVTADLVAAASWSKEKDRLKPAYRTEAARMMRRRAAARVLTDYPEFKVLTAGVAIYEEEDADTGGPVSAGGGKVEVTVEGAADRGRGGMGSVAARYGGAKAAPATDVEAEPVAPQDGQGAAGKAGNNGKAASNGALFSGGKAPAPMPTVAQVQALRTDMGEELWRAACGSHGINPAADLAKLEPSQLLTLAVELELNKPPTDRTWARSGS